MKTHIKAKQGNRLPSHAVWFERMRKIVNQAPNRLPPPLPRPRLNPQTSTLTSLMS